jgi:glycerol-3-phosphate dehydrogenase
MDVLARRLGLALLDQDKALSTLPRVVALMAALLGWDEGRKEPEFAEAKRALPGLC